MKLLLLTLLNLLMISINPIEYSADTQLSLKRLQNDTIPFDKIKFNGLEFQCPISKAILKLGKPDSISFVHEEMSCYEPDTFFYNFKGYRFNLLDSSLINLVDSSLIFTSADFSDKNIEISTPNLKITYKTKINDVLKAYSVSDDNMGDYLNSDGKDVFFIKVPQEKLNVSSEAFIFTFINKKLVKFEYWFDCS